MGEEVERGRGRSFFDPKSGYNAKGRRLSKVGDFVDALWPEDGQYYRARVSKISADGKLALEYEDGDYRLSLIHI